MPSIITYFGGIVTGGSLGVTRQHQAVLRRNVRPVCVLVISGWDAFPRSHFRNESSWKCLVRSGRFRTDDAPQFWHFQRWFPAVFLPFFTRGRSHSTQREG